MNESNPILKGSCPIKLCPNRVWRTYTGGKLLDVWKGLAHPKDCQSPEEWIASTVSVRNPNREHIKNEGLSELEIEPGSKMLLKDLLLTSPELFLGKKHFESYEANPGVLVKALDSQERLTIQVHPDKETARSIFASEFGKTEAWYIIGGREINGEPPYILFGFKPGITRQKWEKMFWDQNIQGMIASMQKFYVKPGQVFLIEGGIPHAIGSGCFLIEIQEPTDYTIRVERKTPSGLEIPDFLCHQGVGFDKMFDCFKFDGYTLEQVINRWCKTPEEFSRKIKDTERVLISYLDTPCFSMNSIEVLSSYKLEDRNCFSTLIVVDGCGRLEWDEGKIDIIRGDELFLPIGLKNMNCINTNEDVSLSMVRCFPPKI